MTIDFPPTVLHSVLGYTEQVRVPQKVILVLSKIKKMSMSGGSKLVT